MISTLSKRITNNTDFDKCEQIYISNILSYLTDRIIHLYGKSCIKI